MLHPRTLVYTPQMYTHLENGKVYLLMLVNDGDIRTIQTCRAMGMVSVSRVIKENEIVLGLHMPKQMHPLSDEILFVTEV